MNIYKEILKSISRNKKLLAVLIDPEKIALKEIKTFIKKVNNSIATHIFVGGSTDKNNAIESVIKEIKKHTILPVLIFPGNVKQVSVYADGILFLSLLSGRNPEYLIDHQIASALKIHKSNLEVIPTGYILIDGGKETSVQKVSKTNPISQTDEELILKTALAGQFSGKKLIYLEAGSGALKTINTSTIGLVKNELKIPIIVGGGIGSVTELNAAYKAGADLAVIGTAFEKNRSFFNDLTKEITNENIS